MNTPAVKLVRHGDVAVIQVDNKPVNALSKAVRQGILDAFAAVADDPAVTAVVIHGGQGRFIAGADIKELAGPLEAPFLPDVIAQIDASRKPVIAAIDGAALGGGLEIALACDRRIASPLSVLALPETRLGLIPGAGGTQRLPRLVGICWAEALIATGEAVKAEHALDIGLVDSLADDPLEKAIIEASATQKRRLSTTAFSQNRSARPDTSFPSSFGNANPAVQAAISIIRETSVLTFEDGLVRERETFLKLRKSKHAQARIHLFLSGKAAFRFPGASGDDRRVLSVAITGSGKRARAIAALLRQPGLSISTDGSDLAEADLIIDTGDDRKTAISIRRLASLAKSNAIIATTRSRDMDRLANSRRGSADIVGLNFRLSSRKSLVEVTPTAATEPAAVNAVLALLRKTGVQAVVSRRSGLVGERIIAACRAAADDLRRRGVSQKDVKTALFSCGMSRSRKVTVSSKKSIDPALRHWLLGEMAREAVTLLSEGIVRQSSDIDLILVHGYGFPDEDGGPIWAAKHILRTAFGVAGGEEEASMAAAEISPTG